MHVGTTASSDTALMASGNVAFAVDGDLDRDWGSLPRAGEHRPVRDLPISHFHVNRIDEDHGAHPVQRPVLPLAHLADDLVGDARDGVLRHRRSVYILEVGRDLAGS